jgi:hypothetical protein
MDLSSYWIASHTEDKLEYYSPPMVPMPKLAEIHNIFYKYTVIYYSKINGFVTMDK